MTSRQERMQGRMRGAGAHQVEDISFAFEIPLEDQFIEEPAPPPPPPPPPPIEQPSTTPAPPTAVLGRPNPNTSAKRKQLSIENASQAPSPTTPPIEGSQSVAAPTSIGDGEVADGATEAVAESSARLQPSGLRRVSYATEVEVRQAEQDGVRSSKRASVPLSSPAATPRSALFAEEVGESPADAPGSGKRRRLRLTDTEQAIGSSTLLQRVVEELEDTIDDGPPSSSPAERRKATKKNTESMRSVSQASSRPAGRRRSPRLSGSSAEDEPSPPRVGEESPVLSNQGDENAEVDAVQEEAEQDIAEEITEREAAQRLGRKRPRRVSPAHSVDLSVMPLEQMRPETVPEPEPEAQPRAKRRRTEKPTISPVAQKQPKTRGPKPKPKPQLKEKPQPKEKPPPKKQVTKKTKAQKTQSQDNEGEAEAGGGSVPVTVQRFIKNREHLQWGSDEEEDDAGADDGIFTAEIPFANRAGVNAVDVLSKLCQELIDAFMSKIQDRLQAAEDTATKREQKTMARALDAFREEVRTRLLEHTTALDTHHALVKRVKVAQKERLGLRDEIMRIRAERDQVGLQMDMIRKKHEADSKEWMRRTELSTTMHDLDLIVERGSAAPPLGDSEADKEKKKKAELAGLEFLMAQVARQVSPQGENGGGALKKIREFNAFLERAAGVLERKS
ncbi:hypothetical protein V8F06_000230 [Rhypophila decipiens]